MAIAVQLQTMRVFWLLDVFATIYLVWWLCERTPRARGAMVTAIVLALSTVRGLYTCYVEFPERKIVDLPPGHPIYHCFYQIDAFPQTPGLGSFLQGRTWEMGGFEAKP